MIKLLQDHVHELQKVYGIRFAGYVPDIRDSKAMRDSSKVWYARIVDTNTYATALHEIGHCTWDTWERDTNYGVLMSELDAWKFANKKALLWDEVMNDAMMECLEEYFDEFPVKSSTPYMRYLEEVIEKGFPLRKLV
jgi:hypothetical protein